MTLKGFKEKYEISLLTIAEALEHGIAYYTKKGKITYALPEQIFISLEEKRIYILEAETGDDDYVGETYYTMNKWLDFEDFESENPKYHWSILTEEKYKEARAWIDKEWWKWKDED